MTSPSLPAQLSRFGRVARRFTPGLKREKPLIAGSLAALSASVLLTLLEPWPLKVILDRVVPTSRPEALERRLWLEDWSGSSLLTLSAFALVAIVALRASMDYFQSVGFARIGNRVTSRIRADVYQRVQALSLAYHAKARSGDLLVRVVGDVKLLRDVAVTALLPLSASACILVGMAAVMFLVNWRLTLLSLLVVPLFALSTLKIGGRIHEAAQKQRRREGRMAATASEAFSAVQVVQALSLEQHFEASFAVDNKKSVKDGVKTQRLSARLERTTDVLIAVATSGVLWVGSHFVLRGEMTPGDLIVFLAYLKRGFRPLRDLAKYAARLAKASAAGERILELLESTPEVRDAPDASPAPAFRGDVRFSGVSFGYAPDAPLYRSLELSVPAGACAAIVGPSGSGKSTILHLLLRLYDPTAGEVQIDGCDIRRFTLASLRSQICVVLQDTVLFAGTLRDNIALGAADVSLEQVIEAARLAQAHDFIRRLPNGYDTLVGERGVTLSRGQRQRIAIARAAVRNAPLLLLDEPTSGLDEANQHAVQGALRDLAKQRTTLLVTHELKHAAEADIVFSIEEGELVEQRIRKQDPGHFPYDVANTHREGRTVPPPIRSSLIAEP